MSFKLESEDQQGPLSGFKEVPRKRGNGKVELLSHFLEVGTTGKETRLAFVLIVIYSDPSLIMNNHKDLKPKNT